MAMSNEMSLCVALRIVWQVVFDFIVAAQVIDPFLATLLLADVSAKDLEWKFHVRGSGLLKLHRLLQKVCSSLNVDDEAGLRQRSLPLWFSAGIRGSLRANLAVFRKSSHLFLTKALLFLCTSTCTLQASLKQAFSVMQRELRACFEKLPGGSFPSNPKESFRLPGLFLGSTSPRCACSLPSSSSSPWLDPRCGSFRRWTRREQQQQQPKQQVLRVQTVMAVSKMGVLPIDSRNRSRSWRFSFGGKGKMSFDHLANSVALSTFVSLLSIAEQPMLHQILFCCLQKIHGFERFAADEKLSVFHNEPKPSHSW